MCPIDAELSTIGAAFLDGAAVVRAGCSAEDFHDPRHRAVWGVLQTLAAEGAPIDCTTVTTRLEARGALLAAGGVEYLGDLAEAAASAGNVAHHGGIVRAAARARRAYRLVTSMGDAVLATILAQAEEGRMEEGVRRALSTVASEAVAALSEASSTHEWVSMRDAKRAAVDRIQARYEANAAGRAPADILPTGLRELDDACGGGLELGHMLCLDGASGSGKTALSLHLATTMAAHLAAQGPPEDAGIVAYYSCEVGATDLAIRDLSRLSGLNSLDVRSGRLHSDGAVDRLLHAARSRGGDGHLRIGYRPAAPVEWIAAEVALLEEQVGPVRAVIIDHWGELTTLRRGLRSDEREASHILVSLDTLKAPTRRSEGGRVVVVAAQHTADGSRLLWGNRLKQLASYCWTWKTPGKGLPDDDLGAMVTRWKMRNGPLGDTRLAWDPATGRIGDAR